jgi:hypothetical protein
MENILARFSLDHIKYIIQEPARYIKNCAENRRAPHLYVVCFEYDENRFQSDLRMGRVNVGKRVY